MSKEKIKTILRYNQDGRITIPLELRRALKLENTSEFWLSVEKGTMTLEPIREKCSFCCANEAVKKVGDFAMCKDCYTNLLVQIKEEADE